MSYCFEFSRLTWWPKQGSQTIEARQCKRGEQGGGGGLSSMMSPGIKQARRAGQHEPCQAAHRQDAGGGWGSCTMVRDDAYEYDG